MQLAPVLAFLSLLSCAFGAVYDQLANLKRDHFDFVIVGGGTAGAVLANRLSEIQSFQVLVVEAGPSNANVLSSQVPFLWHSLLGSSYDWNYTTTPQAGLGGRILPYNRGHILGGSSSINGMVYTRGTTEDYDRWACVTSDQGWSWNKVLPYFKKHERWTLPAEPRNITGQFNPSVHGFGGKTFVSLPGHLQSIDSRVIAAANELGGEFEFNLDMNSGNPLGTTWFQHTIGRGERSSSATSYLTADVLGRSNLHVLLNSRATKITPLDGSKLKLKLGKIEVFGNGRQRVIHVKKEVLLSAGAVGSPHILLHSGIGDAEELKSVGIKPIVDLPSVGKNLTDHSAFIFGLRVNVTDTFDNIIRNTTLFGEALDEWKRERKGLLTATGSNNVLWLRVLNDSAIFEVHPDPSAGANTPQLEVVMLNGGSQDTEPAIQVAVIIVSPASRGTLTINSTNPFDPPIINPNFLTAPVDMFLAREGFRSSRRFLSARAWDGYVLGELSATINATTDDELDAYVRQNGVGAWHPVSTLAMSAKEAVYGVVDPDLKVKKVEGLRVVDASVIPFITAGHTQVPVYVIAERAADLIKREWPV